MLVVENGEQKIRELYSPKSVVEAMRSGIFDNYWNQTETYEALKMYIQMNFDGLKDAVIRMLAGERVPINTGTFSNDMTTFESKDDVLTLLVHLGYLSYHWPDKAVFIPNKEIAQEYINAISTMDWNEVMDSIRASKKLLEALWDGDETAVADGIARAHEEVSILQYNDENSLSCTIHLAFYFAREYYTIIRELPAGKGFADICFLPRKLYADKPALLIELKWNQDVHGAIAQIKERNYTDALKDYRGNLLLVGINYDKKTKTHSCRIERDGKITNRTFANLDKKKSERTVMIRAVENRIRKTGNPVGIRDSHLYCNADEKKLIHWRYAEKGLWRRMRSQDIR